MWGLYAISQDDYMRLVGVTDKALAGKMFDADMNASNYFARHNTRSFPSSYRGQKTLPRTTKYNSVIPDNIEYMSYAAKLSRNPFRVLSTSCIDEIYFEFKLTSTKSLSSSYNNYQLSGMIDILKKSKPLSSKEGGNGFVVVTGSNTNIGKSLIDFTTANNVAIYHSIAQIDDNDNSLIYMGQPILLNPTKDKDQLASEIGIIPTRRVTIGRNGVEEND